MAITISAKNRYQPVGGEVADPSFARRKGEQVQGLAETVGYVGRSIGSLKEKVNEGEMRLAIKNANTRAKRISQDIVSQLPMTAYSDEKSLLEEYDKRATEQGMTILNGMGKYQSEAAAEMESVFVDKRVALVAQQSVRSVQNFQENIQKTTNESKALIASNPLNLEDQLADLPSSINMMIETGVILPEQAAQLQKNTSKEFIEQAIYSTAEKDLDGTIKAEKLMLKYAPILGDVTKMKDEIEKRHNSHLQSTNNEVSYRQKMDKIEHEENAKEMISKSIEIIDSSTNLADIDKADKNLKLALKQDKISPSGYNRGKAITTAAMTEMDQINTSMLVQRRFMEDISSAEFNVLVGDAKATHKILPETATKLFRMNKDDTVKRFPPEDNAAAKSLLDAATARDEDMFFGVSDAEKNRVLQLKAEISIAYADNYYSGKFNSAAQAMRHAIAQRIAPTEEKFNIPFLPKDYQLGTTTPVEDAEAITKMLYNGTIQPKQANEAFTAIDYKEFISRQDNNLKNDYQSHGIPSLREYLLINGGRSTIQKILDDTKKGQ